MGRMLIYLTLYHPVRYVSSTSSSGAHKNALGLVVRLVPLRKCGTRIRGEAAYRKLEEVSVQLEEEDEDLQLMPDPVDDTHTYRQMV